MSLLGVEALIRERLGLDPAALGPAICPRAIQQRMQSVGALTPEEYLKLLTTDPRELAALARTLVVSESWFFRGGRALFDRLAEFVARQASDRPAGIPIRILSLPCSTGEEPYSLAIALHEHRVPPEAYRIVAVDLSSLHVDRATAGTFGSFAFREPGPDVRKTIFRAVDDRWAVLPHVRQAVRFRTGNLTDPGLLEAEPPFDLVLCRNLFIYLTVEARKRATAALDRLLAPGGLLCVTPAEADRLPPGRFVAEGPIEFGFYRRGTQLSPAVASGMPTLHSFFEARETGDSRLALLPPPSVPLLVPERREPDAADPAPAVVPTLDSARGLADVGRLAEALAACAELVRTQTESPEVYVLLGAIHQAEGRGTEAAEAFRKALYLDPDHPDALSHAIVLSESRGDGAMASALRKRLARVTGEGST